MAENPAPSRKYSKKAPVLAAGLVALATLVLGVKTLSQNKILHDPGSLFENVVTYNPSPFAYYELGVYYFGQKDYEKAVQRWQTAEAGDDKRYLNKDALLYMHNSLAYIYLNALSDKSTISLQDIFNGLPSSTRIPEAGDGKAVLRKLIPRPAARTRISGGDLRVTSWAEKCAKNSLTMRIISWFQALTPGQRFCCLTLYDHRCICRLCQNSAFHNAFDWDGWHLIVYNEVLRHWAAFMTSCLKIRSALITAPCRHCFILCLPDVRAFPSLRFIA